MRSRSGRTAATLALVAAVAGVPSSAAAGHHHWHGFRGPALHWIHPPTTDDRDDATFTVQAPPVAGLHPGAVRNLKISVYNPHRHAIRIGGIGAQVTATSTAACAATASNLTVRPRQGRPVLPLLVPARTTRAAGEIPLFMPNTVVNACQRATFTISFSGSAERVGR